MSRALPWTALMDALGEQRFVEIRESLERNRVNPLDRDAFVLDGTVGNLLRDVMAADAPAETVNAYAALLHMLFLAWSAGWPVTTVDAAVLRAAVASDRSPATDDRRPRIAYIQLPENLVWAEPVPGAPHEPVDGAFLVQRDDRVAALAVLGFRPEREGFTTAEATAPVPVVLAPRADASAPFASRLPGGERAGLVSVADETELIALLLLAAGAAPG